MIGYKCEFKELWVKHDPTGNGMSKIGQEQYSMTNSISTVAVIGCGTMGAGICETASVAGLSVLCVEPNEEQQTAGRNRILRSVTRGIERGKLKVANAEEVISRITWNSHLDAASAAEFVIEAVHENEQLKCELFRHLGQVCPPEVILSSNTSSISITKLGAVSGRASQVVGLHFFNPVPIMRPVEIVRGLETSPATLATTEALAKQLGMIPVVVRDSPGFAVNRVLMPLINEAVFALEEGIASAESIDQLMKLGCNHPMGPLELADLIGLDVCLDILDVLHRQLGDPKFRAAPLLRRKVDAGHLGRKAGRGFYSYERVERPATQK